MAPPQGQPQNPGLQVSSFAVPEVTKDALNNQRNSTSSHIPYTPMTPVVPHFPSMVGPTTVHTSTNVRTNVPKVGVAVGSSLAERKNIERGRRKVFKKKLFESVACKCHLVFLQTLLKPHQ